MAEKKKFYVRLRPYEPKRGYLMRTYDVKGLRFLAGGPAQIVTDVALVEKLRETANKSDRQALAFEVSEEPFKDGDRKAPRVVEDDDGSGGSGGGIQTGREARTGRAPGGPRGGAAAPRAAARGGRSNQPAPPAGGGEEPNDDEA